MGYGRQHNTDEADYAKIVMSRTLAWFFGHRKQLRYEPDGQFWHFNRTAWTPASDRWVEGRILEAMENFYCGPNPVLVMHQTLALLKARQAVAQNALNFVGMPPPVINCVNKEIWITPDGSWNPRPHRPDSYLRHCLEVEYDPNEKCPLYDRAIREIFSKAKDPQAMVLHWNELLVYILQPIRDIALIVILLGRGANGKTALASTIMKLLGQALTQSQRVEDFQRPFSMGNLFGKRLFVDDDVRAGARLPDGILKTISEAKEITGEQKHRHPFNFTVGVVPMLLCNNIPSLADLSHGMMRRLMIIPFDRTFGEREQDPSLFQRIWDNEHPVCSIGLCVAINGYVKGAVGNCQST
jgi:putative DNA primase/helicase